MELLTENENKKKFIWKHAENKQNKAKNRTARTILYKKELLDLFSIPAYRLCDRNLFFNRSTVLVQKQIHKSM